MNYILKTTSGNAYRVCVNTDYNAANPVDYMDTVDMFIDTKFCEINSTSFDCMNFKTFNRDFGKIFGRKVKVDETVFKVALSQGYLLLPVWGYSHSGYAFAASRVNPFDKWDSGLAGFIWAKIDQTDYEGNPIDVEQLLVGAVEDFNAYFNNEIYMIGINQIGHDSDCYEWVLDQVTFKENVEEELTLLVLGEVGETAGSLEEYSQEEESRLVHEYKNKVDINSALDDLDVLLDNAVLVRDIDCDTFPYAYIIFSNKSKVYIENLVKQIKEKWNDLEDETYGDESLITCIENALVEANVKYKIVNLDDFRKLWV